MKQTFPKSEKLCSQIAISNTFKKGKKYFKYPFRMYVLSNHSDINKVLISVPKKMQKLAVNRNHLKRLTREAYRINKNIYIDSEKQTSNIAFVYLSKEIVNSEIIHQSIESLLKKIKSEKP